MWRRSGDGEVYAYMPNEQVIWIVIQIIDNKALKWCDFDHAVIKIMGQIMKMKFMALTITSPIFFRLRDSARSLTSIATMSMVTPWAEEPGGHHDNNVECCWVLLVLVDWKFDTWSKTPYTGCFFYWSAPKKYEVSDFIENSIEKVSSVRISHRSGT